MKTIDFLPASYGEQSSKRKLKLWRAAVVALIGGAVVSASFYQRYLIWQVEDQLAELEPQYAAAEAVMVQHGDLQQQLQQAVARADLYTYLRHPWPRTQVLAAVVGPLPESVTLSELRMMRDTSGASSATKPAATDESQQGETKNVDPAKRDLEQLRQSIDSSRVVINLTGMTDDLAALHEYLARVRQSKLIHKAEIKSIEAAADLNSAKSQFTAELVVRPGYGQPGGPEPKTLPESAGTPVASGDHQEPSDRRS